MSDPIKRKEVYRDYACRLDGGSASIPIHQNFISAWHRATTKGRGRDLVISKATLDGTENTKPSEQHAEMKAMRGFLLPFEDNRSSTVRLG